MTLHPSEQRTEARVTFPDGTVISAPVGTAIETYFKFAYPHLTPVTRGPENDDTETVVAAIINGELKELSYPIRTDAEVRPILISDSDGLRIYRRALSLLLITAGEELFPERKITISHGLPFGGYYCTTTDHHQPFSAEDLARLKARMLEIVEADEPITRVQVTIDEAIEIFTRGGDDDKLRLLKSRKKDYVILYHLRGTEDYFYGYMTPSTGYLNVFDITPDGAGFILHFPRRQEPTVIQPVTDMPKLRGVFGETQNWLELLGVEDIGMLNALIREGRAREIILVSEALHEGRYADIADMIVERQPDVRLVLIAGPTSSGKTTSSKRLAVQLMAHGLKPFTLAMDDYFVDRDKTPKDEKGDYDFEHLHALDLDLFNDHLLALMDGEEVRLPHYNFHTGKQEKGKTAQITDEHILIVEGIHGLNPELVRSIPNDRLFRLYVSCLTQLNIDRHNRIPTTDVRMIRRTVRDAQFRGYSALDTLSRWQSVRAGERRWIFPFQENSEVMFNSSLVYELAVLRPFAQPLLRQVERDTRHHIEARRLLTFLDWVEPLNSLDLIPPNSIIREFTGGSILDDYTPGRPEEGH